jgi:hypothetical protein
MSAILVDILVRPKSFRYTSAIFVPVGMAQTQNRTKKFFGIGLGRTSGDTLRDTWEPDPGQSMGVLS